MADKYIDKFKYNDRYFLLDSGATHESNTHYLSGTLGNFKSNGTIVAEQGLFNKLIATSANISTLDVDSLTAQNATVVGLLDVQGQLKTNTWTNSNIATIEGNFFIAPTVVSKSTSSTKYQLTIQNQTSTNSEISSITGQAKRGWVLTISGNFDLNQIGADLVSGESSTILNQWSQGSKVLITGDIEKTDGVYPLGTLTGFIYSSTTSSGSTPGSITIYNVTDNLGNTDIFTILGANTYNYREIKVSLTQRYYSGMRPIGILMSAQGRSSKSFIDIYGGANQLQSGTISGASSDYGGLAIPNVRIGNLRGLPNVRSGDFTNDAALPTGWGIYTDNGYFKGTIVSTSGEIGGFTIGLTSISNGTSSISSTTTEGIYVGTDGFLNVSSASTTGRPYTQITNGVITAQGAKLLNLKIYDSDGKLRAGVITSGFIIYDGASATTTTQLASFGATTVIGQTSQPHLTLDGSTLIASGGSNGYAVNYFEVGNAGSTTTSITESFDFTLDNISNPTVITLSYIPTAKPTLKVNNVITNFPFNDNLRIVSISNLEDGDHVDITYDTYGANGYFTFGNRRTGSDIGINSFSVGTNNIARGNTSYAEGFNTIANGAYSHAEGYRTLANGLSSHAEGNRTIINGMYSHAEGNSTTANGDYAHTEGTETTTAAASAACHAEGAGTTAGGVGSHAEGGSTTASGNYSHSGGYHTIAGYDYQTVIGKWNNNQSTNAFEIGWGTSSPRKNIFEVDTSGNVNIASGAKYKINGTALTASDVGAVPTTRTINSKALSSNITLTASDVNAYPVGSVYVGSTNTNPNNSSLLGFGTWTLIDKQFASQVISSTNMFTINTSGTTSLDSASYAMLDGHSIHIRLMLTNKVALSDSTVTLGTVRLANCGMTSGATGVYASYPIGYTDAGNGIIMGSCTNTGVLTSEDVVTKTSGGSVAASNVCRFDWWITCTTIDSMIDSFCDKFYWKRTA